MKNTKIKSNFILNPERKRSMFGVQMDCALSAVIRNLKQSRHLTVATVAAVAVLETAMIIAREFVKGNYQVELVVLKIARITVVEDVRRDVRPHALVHVKTVVRVALMIKIILLNMLVLIIHVELDVQEHVRDILVQKHPVDMQAMVFTNLASKVQKPSLPHSKLVFYVIIFFLINQVLQYLY